jgi:hypothetical protein
MNNYLNFLIYIFVILSLSCEKKKVKTIHSGNPTVKLIKLNENKLKNMRTLPNTVEPLVLRTDFSNEKEWEKICKEILTPNPEFGFIPNVIFSNNILFKDFSEEQIYLESKTEYYHAFIFIIDKITSSNKEHPILCVGMKHNKGLKIRVIPSEMWCIENNLSIANMDFEDFSNSVDPDGIFRGF